MSQELNGQLVIPQFTAGQKAPEIGTPPSGDKPEKSVPTSPGTEKIPTGEATSIEAKELVEAITAATRPDPGTEEEPADGGPPASVDVTLAAILQWKRPHDSAAEVHFVSWLHQELARRGANFKVGPGGCVVVTMALRGKGKKKAPIVPKIMFSCHTDTVHRECSGKQNILYDAGMGHIFLDKKDPTSGSCLGADDGAGIWLCLEMIRAKVPGVYVFHRGEEVGGVGSRAMLRDEKAWLENFDVAIAFDRKGQEDIITHQGGQRCASDAFGLALAKALNSLQPGEFKYKLSQNGSFTDTKVYAGVISECLNVSCGYENAHSQDETLNYEHLVLMRNALIGVDWHTLVSAAERDPKAVPPPYVYKPYVPGQQRYGRGSNVLDFDNRDDDGFGAESRDPVRRGNTPPVPPLLPPKQTVTRTRGLVSMSRGIQEPEIMEELRCMTTDELYEVLLETDAAVSVVMALWAELEAMKAKAEMYRSLTQLD